MKSSRKKTILWIDDYPSPFRAEAKNIISSKNEVAVRTSYRKHDGSHEKRKWASDSGASFGYFNMTSNLLKALLNRSVVIIESPLTLMPFIVLMAPLIMMTKAICINGHVPDSHDSRSFKERLRRAFAIFCKFIFSAVVSYSKKSAEFSQLKGCKSFVGYGSSIKNSGYSHGNVSLDQKEGRAVLLIGSWNERKRFTEISNEIFDYSDRFNLGIEIWHIGNADSEIKINNGNRIKFFGHIQGRDEIKQICDRAFVSILGSSREPWGHVTIECMAMGLPVLISENCGSSIAVKNVDAKLVFDIKIKNSMINSLIYLLSLDGKSYDELSTACIQEARNHTVDNFISALNSAVKLISKD